MLDIKLIRDHFDEVQQRIQTKEADLSLQSVIALDDQLRKLKAQVEELKAERNTLSKQVGERKRTGASADDLMAQVAGMGDAIAALDHEIREVEERFTAELASIPNLPMDDIPIAPDKSGNLCIHSWKEKPLFDFEPKHHLELNEKLHLFDFVRGAKVTGRGWPIYRDWGARLEWALLHYMVDLHHRNGYMQWMLPLCVRPQAMYGSGQIPKFSDQMFSLDDEEYPFYLIPTGEVPLNALHTDEILPEEELPLRYFAYTPCFRREAGAAGSGERGLIRVHQFNKVEMFCFTTPGQSGTIFQEMVRTAESILEGLGLHYRSMLLATGDMSFGAARTVDVEVWLPGQDRYYEVSSVSNCTDYQARRSQIRFRAGNEKPQLVHTLNGSGLATSRLMVALLENNQQADGSVILPEALRPYLGGKALLTPDEAI